MCGRGGDVCRLFAPVRGGRAVGRSGDAGASDPPDAGPGEQQGKDEEDRGLIPLEGPEAAGGLVGDQLPEVKSADRGQARLEVATLAGPGERAVERVAGLVDSLVGEDPATLRGVGGRRDYSGAA